jgi:hypothetical protein
MAHDSPNSGSVTAAVFIGLGAVRSVACLCCSSEISVVGPKAAAAALVIDSSEDQKDRLDISFCLGFAGRSCSAGFSGRGGAGVDSPLPSAACVVGCGFAGLGAAGRRRWSTSLAPGPAAGTRSSTSRRRMRSDLTCQVQCEGGCERLERDQENLSTFDAVVTV